MNKQRGFSIVELVIFIVIIGLMAAGSLVAFKTVLSQNSNPAQNLQASLLADARMNMIILNRLVNGFTSIGDPCAGGSPPAACVALSNFATSINQTISVASPVAGTISSGTGSTPTSTVTVSVTGTGRATNQVVFVQ